MNFLSNHFVLLFLVLSQKSKFFTTKVTKNFHKEHKYLIIMFLLLVDFVNS